MGPLKVAKQANNNSQASQSSSLLKRVIHAQHHRPRVGPREFDYPPTGEGGRNKLIGTLVTHVQAISCPQPLRVDCSHQSFAHTHVPLDPPSPFSSPVAPFTRMDEARGTYPSAHEAVPHGLFVGLVRWLESRRKQKARRSGSFLLGGGCCSIHGRDWAQPAPRFQ